MTNEPNSLTGASISPWKELSRSTVFEKFGRGIDEVVFELPTGQQDSFYIKTERPAACVLALTEAQKVVIAKQYRPGPGEVLLELPGGYIDHGENPAEAMHRELLRGVPRSHEVEDLEGSVHETGCPSGGLGDVASPE